MDKPYIITIAGGTASGKSTLTERLLSSYGARSSAVRVDSYYRDQGAVPMSERVKANYDHPDSLEFTLLVEHLELLKRGQYVLAPIYDFSQHTRDLSRQERIDPSPIIIVEGILALWAPAVRELSDLKVFVDAPPAVRFTRRLERDVRERGRTPEGVKQQWELTVEPMYQQLCAPTAAYADLVIDGTSSPETLLDTVLKISKIQAC